MKFVNQKIRIAKAEFKGQHHLEFDALLEFNERGFPDDIVFISLVEEQQFDSNKTHHMQVKANDLRAIIEAAKDLLQNGEGAEPFEKHTRKQNALKILTLGMGKKEKRIEGKAPVSYPVYFINIIEKRVKYSMGMDSHYFGAFTQRLEFLVQKLEGSLYDAQKHISAQGAVQKFNKEQ